MKEFKMEFKSINEFEKYICESPLNVVFRWQPLSSSDISNPWFHGTQSFDEALQLMRHGWEDMAKKIEKTLKLKAQVTANNIVKRAKYDVVGFQASVPRYLQGVPTNMVNKKSEVQKQKVITIVKHMSYLGTVSEKEIIENSIKALQIVKAIEEKGIRVNLDIMSPTAISKGSHNEERIICRVRVKAAGERMNISKLAFPLVHPSMLRRMIFRFREVIPGLTNESWRCYGVTIQDRKEAKKYLNEGEYYLHNFIDSVEDEIKQMGL